jgi:hypothetical protein
MANRCERLINVVMYAQAKDADRLDPKGMWLGIGAARFSYHGQQQPPAKRARPNPSSVTQTEHGKPDALLWKQVGSRKVRLWRSG